MQPEKFKKQSASWVSLCLWCHHMNKYLSASAVLKQLEAGNGARGIDCDAVGTHQVAKVAAKNASAFLHRETSSSRSPYNLPALPPKLPSFLPTRVADASGSISLPSCGEIEQAVQLGGAFPELANSTIQMSQQFGRYSASRNAEVATTSPQEGGENLGNTDECTEGGGAVRRSREGAEATSESILSVAENGDRGLGIQLDEMQLNTASQGEAHLERLKAACTICLEKLKGQVGELRGMARARPPATVLVVVEALCVLMVCTTLCTRLF